MNDEFVTGFAGGFAIASLIFIIIGFVIFNYGQDSGRGQVLNQIMPCTNETTKTIELYVRNSVVTEQWVCAYGHWEKHE